MDISDYCHRSGAGRRRWRAYPVRELGIVGDHVHDLVAGAELHDLAVGARDLDDALCDVAVEFFVI